MSVEALEEAEAAASMLFGVGGHHMAMLDVDRQFDRDRQARGNLTVNKHIKLPNNIAGVESLSFVCVVVSK